MYLCNTSRWVFMFKALYRMGTTTRPTIVRGAYDVCSQLSSHPMRKYEIIHHKPQVSNRSFLNNVVHAAGRITSVLLQLWARSFFGMHNFSALWRLGSRDSGQPET